MSAHLIDWSYIAKHELRGSGEQSFKCLNSRVHLTSPYLNLKIVYDMVQLVLISGPERKSYTYSLSEIFIPCKGGIINLTQSHFVIPLINSLDDYLLRTPPHKVTSFKNFSDIITTNTNIIEYFALKGKYGLDGVSNSDVARLMTEAEKGWFVTLMLQERFDNLKYESTLPWFIKRSQGSKSPNEMKFNLPLFKKVVGTSLFKKTINDIPPSIISKLDIPDNLRTPYKYSGRADRSNTSTDLIHIRGCISNLFEAQALPIRLPEISIKAKSETDKNRTKTPTVDTVSTFAKQLFSVIGNGESLAGYFAEIIKIIGNHVPGDMRKRLIKESIIRCEPIPMFNENFQVTKLRQIRGKRVKNEITLGEAYKIYSSAIAYLTLLFTGWRLGELCDKHVGLSAENVNYTMQDNLTLINRNVLKSEADQYERQLSAVGPHIGRLLSELHKNNRLFASDYSDSTSFFNIKVHGLGGGSPLSVDLSSNNPRSNPLRHFIARDVEVPTPKQLRRYFAVVYFYQFDNSEIMALTHHYGHSSPKETEVYITDTPTRNAIRSINDSIPIKNVITSTDTEFNRIFEDARDAKLKDMVGNALNCTSTAGFSKNVRALYRKILGGISFADLDAKEKSKAISKVFKQVKSEGYSVEVYSHGNCTNSSKHANSSDAKCANEDGIMEREHASAGLCSRCPFHDVQSQHVVNLKAELASLNNSSVDIDDIFACTKTPLVQAQINKQIDELKAVIDLYEDEDYSS